MEQLYKLFKCSDVQLSDYQSIWANYISENEKSSSQITVDLNLINHAPISKLENIIYVSIEIPNPMVNGMPIDTDEIALYHMENQIIEKLNLRGVDYAFAGFLTSNNVRDFYFYSNRPTVLKNTITSILRNFPEFEFSFGYRMDKNWNVYLDFLYPLPNQLQKIHNERIVEKLAKNGDRLEREREIYHWVFFKHFDDLEEFEDFTLSNNFRTIKKEASKSVGDYPWMIEVAIKEAASLEVINNTTLKLLKEARFLDGYYDGWETYTR